MKSKDYPSASPGQKKEMDLLMNELGINTVQMMELAGRDIARLATKINKGPYLIFCGKGHNAGDGLCAAKHLINWNFPTAIILVEPELKLKKEEKDQLATLKHMNASIFRFELPDLFKIIAQSNLIIDALIGSSLNSAPKGNIKKAIELINKHKKKVLCVDIPTGTDGLTGENYKPSIKASHTISLGIPLKGLINNKNAGKLYVSDIGIPDKVYTAVKIITKPRFQKKEIIRI